MLSTLPSQDNVKKNWESDEVKVTCLVTCYNHEKYILDCLKGIFSQKTKFAFKVVVYDDFSSDNTRNILMSLERQYPAILQVYYADYNHYGNSIQNEHAGMLEGSYVALCEGDDYWISRYKLQKQFDEMERNRGSISFCVHPSIIFSHNSRFEDIFCFYGTAIKILPQKLVFDFKNQFSPTASYFLKLEKFLEHVAFKEYLEGGPGDFFLEAIASEGGVLYLPEIMSCYRRGSIGSYSAEQSKLSPSDIQKEIERWDRNLSALSEYYPKLQKMVTFKRTLVEIDCLIRLSNVCKKKNKADYVAKAQALLKELGPMENYL
ncbi:glycosyltransferase family 2 protein [Halomonas sp. DWK9]|uniref:glycosyltransferase family 2 protein n=1 Tax=Halomonas sp. DWK9 TaxID=3060155 RepID=UPI00287FC62E|nr:glycosyltransferase family 2 protein [Halomonas sp. DWK9]